MVYEPEDAVARLELETAREDQTVRHEKRGGEQYKDDQRTIAHRMRGARHGARCLPYEQQQ